MHARFLLLPFLLGLALLHARAVETVVSGTGTIDNTAPTNADVPNWETGWGESGITGWDYVGNINGGASAVYLGDDWVITAAHVGAGTFNLDGLPYDMVPGSARSFLSASGSMADITLFQVSQGPDLPSLNIATRTPGALSRHSSGTPVVMIGNGGGESWGYDTITCSNVPVELDGAPYETTDFETAYGLTTDGTNSATNNAFLISGDSGGGDFTYNTRTGTWTLAGLNEAIDGDNNSYMIQLSAYASQINPVVAVPEPGEWVFCGWTLAALLFAARRKG